MPHPLSHNAYGKHRVRVSKIKRSANDPQHHEFIEATVAVTLEGDLAESYTLGDNTNVVATDTCRNTVYAKAKDDPFDTIESFGVTLAEHFLSQYDHLTKATVELREHRWHRLDGHGHCFTGSDGETPTATVVAERGQATTVSAGLDDLMIAKTTQTGFENFHRDEYRTLPDTDDRIFATVLTASWDYASADTDFAAARAAIRDAMLAKFTDHYSKSVQETLYLMANAGLDTCADATSITLTMPNKHHLRFNLEPLGRTNDNEVFHVTDEPYGYITGTVTRQ
ncbi:factor-independent urate hydroxylase [Algisphaera agarilytica]|uniref:Uricase n=1 Tax=Algisphaera agarilytica TaxID=1385975 RepID=A0A7X0LL34_9BACT|nr:urate oxidase [Algisphaera agarilytica]MBB6429573.1 urate oxidase [Algisphaera agarilytica]